MGFFLSFLFARYLCFCIFWDISFRRDPTFRANPPPPQKKKNGSPGAYKTRVKKRGSLKNGVDIFEGRQRTSTSHRYSVNDSRVPFILNDSVPGVPKAEMTEYPRIPGVLKAEITEYARVPEVPTAEMAEYSRVPGVPKLK